MRKQEKLSLANLPTRIEKLKISSHFKHINVFIKRDDQTGFELSGNKVRKLEYIIKYALDHGFNHLITCGGLQSNHVRATAACAAKYDMKCTALLKGEPSELRCNYYMTHTFGAAIEYITSEAYKYNRHDIMTQLKSTYELQGDKVLIIPEGASNGLGNLGYFDCFNEIEDQIDVDAIAVAVGSCGTYAGLILANQYHKKHKAIIGINIYDAAVDYNEKVKKLMLESEIYFDTLTWLDDSKIDIRNEYVGEGYGITQPEVRDFMNEFAKSEGILLDPVYTGKAFYGLYQELLQLDKRINQPYDVLFIHTGGTFMYEKSL